MIKKITYFVLFLFIFKSSITYANCSINTTPDYIFNFIQNVNKVKNNVISKVWSIKTNEENNNLYWKLNTLFSWTADKLEADYYTLKEVPKKAKRDIELLKKEYKKIKIDSIKKDWILTYKDICAWIEEKYCNINKYDKLKASSVLLKLKKSISQVRLLLIKQVVTKKIIYPEEKIFLFPKEEINKIKNDYSKENLAICEADISGEPKEKWFLATILEALNKINFTNIKNNDALATWKEALDLLYWKSQEHKIFAQEKQNIKEEISSNTPRIIINNNLWFNKKTFLTELKSDKDSFKQALKELFPQVENPKSNHTVWTIKVIKEYKKIKSEQVIVFGINEEYKKLKKLSLQENINNENLINRLINMHINLSLATNIATKTCRISQKVCNEQLTWIWDCWQCY